MGGWSDGWYFSLLMYVLNSGSKNIRVQKDIPVRKGRVEDLRKIKNHSFSFGF